MAMRITGMYSGLDTESIISELVSAKRTSVTKLQNEQKKLEWKQTVWQDLNSKIYSFFNNQTNKMKYESAFTRKKTSSSNENVASVVAGDNAVMGSQTLQVKSLAQTGYLTGAKIKATATTDNTTGTVSSSTKLTDINSNLEGSTISVSVGGGTATNISISSDTTVSNLITSLKNAGVNASFDATNQRFFVNGTAMGTAKDFTISGSDITADDSTGTMSALRALGLDTTASSTDYETLFGTASTATKTAGQDAEIVLNGATFTAASNTFTINGLTIDVKGTTATDEVMTITTSADTDGIYDMIKGFFSEYNDMINEVCRLYNADSTSDYEVLSSEQKDSMTDDEIDTWETTIKDSLLRRDTTLSTLISTMNSIMNSGVTVNGNKMYLSDFGIGTLNYFEAEDNEHYAYHIDGDEDDESTSANTDKLKSMIATDPSTVSSFFSSLNKTLYEKLNTMMASTDYSSVYKIYNDKQLKEEYSDYDDEIEEAQDKLADYEDKWYDKFSAMEVALSKLQSNQTTVSSMLG